MSKDEEREDVCDKERQSKARKKSNAAGDSSGCREVEILWGFERGNKDGSQNGYMIKGDGNEADGEEDSSRTQDVDNSYLPSLNDEISLLVLARVPRSEYQKLCLVNRRYRSLVRSGELYTIRKEIGIKEPTVLLLASGEPHWWCYHPRSGSRRNLPILPCDPCFQLFDKESLCVGTHLLVSGKEIEGSVIWRYELEADQWFKGPSMLSPRCLFASASCGSVACVAGGIGVGHGLEILNTAEKYNPENKSWNPLPRMNKRRKLSAGCYMDNKFYVVGGQNENGDNLTCGEYYDQERKIWQLIPDMIKDTPIWSSRSPPLLAVVNNELYSLEAFTNHLKVYLKKSNTWKDLGIAPVRADHSRGWGVAFKSLGDELLVIGSTAHTYTCRGMTICTCKPNPHLDSLQWRVIESESDKWSSFIFNCSIMVA
ncbi:F-box/kelch-repeat protein At3g27150 [Typha latifolia]|uniref:F-box/kelch-repeat protein At3g27150 n=1 Tax=Typha latifolia TaxID=4733 RepID=UPI003C2DB8AB